MALEIFPLIFCMLVAVFVGCFVLLLRFLVKLHLVHKANEHIPGPPRSSFILGHLPDVWKYKATTGRTFGEFLLEKRLQYGPIFVLFFLNRAIVFLGDSSYLKHVFVDAHSSVYKSSFLYKKLGFVFGVRGMGHGLLTNTNDASWRKRRRLMNPAFHRKCLRDFMKSFNAVCDRFLARMDAVVEGGRPATSMVLEFRNVTLEAISQVSFNINTRAIEDPSSSFPIAIEHYVKGVQDSVLIPLSSSLLGSIFQFELFQTADRREQIRAVKYLRKYASDCVKARIKDIANETDVPDDLLTVLIKDESLSMDDILDEFITIFIAGQDTTASCLSFTLYEIIRNRHVEAKLLSEVKDVLGERDHVEFDDLAKLKYLGQVLDESLRKHPVVPSPFRILSKDVTVGGFRIPKRSGVASNQLLFGMNPEFWKDPEVFEPERFSSAENMQYVSTTHFPFSIGPRNCIGQTYARFEMKVILAKLLRKYQFSLLPGQTDRMEERVTITTQDGVLCKVTRRE